MLNNNKLEIMTELWRRQDDNIVYYNDILLGEAYANFFNDFPSKMNHSDLKNQKRFGRKSDMK